MMNSIVFENWMDYVSDGQAEELEEVLEDIKKKVVSFALATGICKCGDVVTFFEIELEDGQELCLPAYEIDEDTDGMEARSIVEANYEIYIVLLWKLCGIKPFKEFNKCVSFDYYLNEITELIDKSFGKVPDTGDCETCSMCCHASIDWLVA